MNLEKHISTLLYRYDCVIVPNFGGFLTQKISAQFDNVTHEFLPPSKELRFNSSLNNDGLLVNYISQVENSTYEEVLNSIQLTVNNWKTQLIEGRELNLDRIGTFCLNEEGNLVFSLLDGVNYSKDSFGLTSVRANYIIREKNDDKVVIPFSFRKFSTAAAGIALLALVGAYGYSKNDKIGYQMANMFDTSSTEIKSDLSHFKSHYPALYPQPFKEENIVKDEFIESTTVINTVDQPEEKVVASIAKKHTEKQIGSYQLVGGAFKSKSNAEKKLKQLKSQGYSNAQILGVLSGMTIVSYDTFNNKKEANIAKDKLEREGKEVWLRIK